MSNRDVIASGFKGFPDCEECQCYPECRNDCPDYLQCVRRLPEYAERVFGSDQKAWPPELARVWRERGWETFAVKYARRQTARPEPAPAPRPSRLSRIRRWLWN